MSNTLNGRTLKYGDSTTLRFEVPESWNQPGITAVAVSVTDESGTALASGSATLWTSSKLDVATIAHATTIVLEAGAATLYPGDRIIIGASGENREIREVFAYASTTRTVTLCEELVYDHADAGTVAAMWLTYALDLSNTTTFPKGTKLYVRWTPDSYDPAYVESFIVGDEEFSEGNIWGKFRTRFRTEYSKIESLNREEREDLIQMARDAMRLEIMSKGNGLDMDRIQDMSILQEGMLLRLRLQILSGSGDQDEMEYGRAKDEWLSWLDAIIHLPMWQDTDQDNIVDDTEVAVVGEFFESIRYS